MKNPFQFLQKKPLQGETYLGIFLKEQEGIILFLTQRESRIEVLTSEKFTYTDGWEHLVEDIDEVLNRLETTTGKSPEKTIFFVYSHLIDMQTKEIRKPYLTKIKELAKGLELKPLGFIECHEAVVEYLQQTAGTKLTALVVEFDKTSLDVFAYAAGNLIYSEVVPRTTAVVDDLTPVFERIKEKSVLPPRIILYNSHDLDIESANILTHQWGKDFFVQLPKVEIIKEMELIQSLTEIFKMQLFSAQEALQQTSIPAAPMIGEDDLDSDDLDEDIHQDTKPEAEAVSAPSEVMGFVIGGDVEEATARPPEVQEQTPFVSSPSPSVRGITPMDRFKQAASSFLGAAQGKLQTFMSLIKKAPFPVLPVVGGILIVGSLFAIEYFFHTAHVTVFLPSQTLSKDLSVEAKEPPVTGNQLALSASSKTNEFSDQESASGRTATGDRAKGEVTILNYQDSEKTFDKGTSINSQGLAFVLNDDVKVASSSIAGDLSLQPGKAKVGVTASQIGPESNLAKGQRFQIDDSPQTSYLATNDSAFSGGSKQDIRVVSKADAAAVDEAITKKAHDYTNHQITATMNSSEVLLSSLTNYDTGKITYDNNVGEQAESVTGKTTIKITYYVVKKSDLFAAFQKQLGSELKPGYHLSEKDTKYSVKKADGKDGVYTLTMGLTGRAVEDIKKEDVMKNIIGKQTSQIEETLKNKYHADGAEFQVHHPIPFLNGWLPPFEKNITLDISYL